MAEVKCILNDVKELEIANDLDSRKRVQIKRL
jgi:hypothetical protein